VPPTLREPRHPRAIPDLQKTDENAPPPGPRQFIHRGDQSSTLVVCARRALRFPDRDTIQTARSQGRVGATSSKRPTKTPQPGARGSPAGRADYTMVRLLATRQRARVGISQRRVGAASREHERADRCDPLHAALAAAPVGQERLLWAFESPVSALCARQHRDEPRAGGAHRHLTRLDRRPDRHRRTAPGGT
jgi:hypothetical protein